ncbi:hypothetical protein EST38_g5033 [Candolleomyces aberdarensis]|uniref:Uncharacterized protein n=1 Tax=Candolleomyces aberdarensis TaxID=2316362 RepID=A0A4Q2DLF0_9AGAR|nr:hypothetical protein EST38_g5033 [Candolleomyces aberdarensis]
MSDSEGDYGSVDAPVVAAEDIPDAVDRLKSIEYDDFIQACETLNTVLDAQEELATDHLLPRLPSILVLVNEIDNDDRRSALLEIVCKLAAMNDQGRAAVKNIIKDLLPALLIGSFSDRSNILQPLETLLEEEDSSLESQVLEFFTNSIYAPVPTSPNNLTAEDYGRCTNAGEVLQIIFTYGQTRTRAIALKAKAIEFVILSASLPDLATRKGAIVSLTLVYSNIHDIAESFPDKDVSTLQQWILTPLLELLQDDDFTIATEIADFLQLAEFPEGFLRAHPTFNLDLVRYLGRWDPQGNVPFPTMLYDRLLSEDEDNNVVVDGFRRLWSEEDLDVSVKLQVLDHLASLHNSIRQEAIKGGATSYVLKSLQTNDETRLTAILNSVQKILEDDQTFGGHLFEAGVIPKLINLFQNGSTETRCLASSALSRLLESYSIDTPEPIRKDIAKVFVSSDVLPHILSATKDPNLKVVGSVFELFSNLLSQDDCESGDHEDKSASLKDQVVTDTLVNTATTYIGVPEATEGATQFLTRACWDYPRGFDLVQTSFRATIPIASATFFAALHPAREGLASWDARSHLISAAIKADAFNRVQQLLAEPLDSAEDIRLGVRAVRALLWGEDVDRNIGRQNEQLAKLIVKLLVDGSFESLTEAQQTVDMLAEYGVADPFKSWSDVVSTPEVVDSLLKHMGISQEKEEEPDIDGLSGEEYQKVLKEYHARQKAAENRHRSTIVHTVDLIKNLLHILHSYKARLAGPLLQSAIAYPRSTTIAALESFVSSETADVTEFEPLVDGAKYVLNETEDPPGVDELLSLLGGNPILTLSFYLAGVLPDIQTLANDTAAQADSESEDSDRETLTAAVELFTLVANRLKGRPSYILDTQELFFATPPLVKLAHSTVVKATSSEDEDTYDEEKFDSLNMADNLFTLCNGYPQGISALVALEPSILPTLLTLYDDGDCDPQHCAPLLGLVASHVDLEVIVDMVKQHIKQLSPPAEAEAAGGGGGKGGKKKGKKPKAYKPRLSREQVLQRISLLLHGQSLDKTAVKRIVGESGALDLVLKQLLGQQNDVASHQVSPWVLSLKFVQALLVIETNNGDAEEDDELFSKILEIMERLFGIWTNSKQGERVRSTILRFLSALTPSTSRAGDSKKFDVVPRLVEMGWLQALVHRICSYPADVGGIDLLIQPILAFALAGEAGRKAVIDAFKGMFESDEALDLERTSGWGVAYAVKRIVEKQDLDKDFAAAKLDWLAEAGVIEYAARLMRENNLKLEVFGVSLAASVALYPSCASVIPLLSQHDVQPLAESIATKIASHLADPLTTGSAEGQSEDDEEPQDRIDRLTKWKTYVEECSLILKGEKVDGFDKFYVL